MYGQQPPFGTSGGRRGGGGGGGRGWGQPRLGQYHQSHPQPTLQNQIPNIFVQHPAFPFLQNLTLANQFANFIPPNQNPPNQPPHYNQVQVPSLQNPSFPVHHSNLPPPDRPSFPPQPPQTTSSSSSQKPTDLLREVDAVVSKARRQLIAAGENVSAWKVSQAALEVLKADTWSSLGLQMNEVPSLQQLMHLEGKVNSFIDCFVGVRQITSFHDLEVAICKNEGVEHFDQLLLGPLLRHPLVLRYFSIQSPVIKVHKIRSEKILELLCEFLDVCEKDDVDEFLSYIAEKQSVPSSEKLVIRIQSLAMHTFAIREGRKLENATIDNFLKKLKQKSKRKLQKRPLFSDQKKELDERFSAITERIRSFSSLSEGFGCKHTKFHSSSSEDEEDSAESDDNGDKQTSEGDGISITNMKIEGKVKISGKLSSLPESRTNKSDHVNRCPYPSEAEEKIRLGLKAEMDASSSPSGASRNDGTLNLKRKRKSEATLSSVSCPKKMQRVEMDKPVQSTEEVSTGEDEWFFLEDHSLSSTSMQIFITTWKETCRQQTIAEVLKRMLLSYDTTPRQRKRLISMFSTHPFVGLLNVAVKSIKDGMWDSIYDCLQAIDQHEVAHISENDPKFEIIDIQPSVKNSEAMDEYVLEEAQSVPVRDIVQKITSFFEHESELMSNSKLYFDNMFKFSKFLCDCEHWVAEKFSVKEFRCLGYGEFPDFLERHASLLPGLICTVFKGDACGRSPLNLCVHLGQLVALVSQAKHNSWVDETITEQMVAKLIGRQFPSIDFKLTDESSLEVFLDIMGKHEKSAVSKCVQYSITLLGSSLKQETLLYGDGIGSQDTEAVQKTAGFDKRIVSPVSCKDAIEVLLKAPILSDLVSWSHWEQIFAPSLGHLIEFLLNEVNSEELLCLVTVDGKVIRLDHSATSDSFLEAALKCSPFLTAMKLLSFCSLVGGVKHVPLSLLKCHACRAFEAMTTNYNLHSVLHGDGKVFVNKLQSQVSGSTNCQLADKIGIDQSLPSAARFFIDCLGYVPIEFHAFFADILLCGLRSVMKNAPSIILKECNKLEERMLLHGVGLALGIVEWIDDYYSVIFAAESYSAEGSHPCKKVTEMDNRTSLDYREGALNQSSHTTAVKAKNNETGENVLGQVKDSAEDAGDSVGAFDTSNLTKINEQADPIRIIESIRRDEFGIDPTLSVAKSSILEKQHARLGRALHCLSQELYSQDSHFLLELVQNADDNIYPENVEPTLTLILQASRIVVLNNERGFSADNIRALCDVGNSTKKGSSVGYIGQKGIGFKSVFRVSDSPEVHSNGFHVKFDVTEGQIGFILPTTVPPCDVGLFSRLTSFDTHPADESSWNTCILLPFRSSLLERPAMNSIATMFSDLHPSLLLFLHRLKCIKFRDMLSDSMVIMRKEVVGDGIVKVSQGKDEITWLVVSQKLKSNIERRNVQETEISLAFTLQELDDGYYAPCLEQQPVFAFLPLRTYGFKFILQGDFILPSSREEVDGDSSWNQWLLSAYPDLFLRAEEYFCNLPCFRENSGKAVSAYMSFVPIIGEVHGFFASLPRTILHRLRMSNCLLQEGGCSKWVPPCKVIRGWDEEARILLPDSLLQEHLGLGFLNKDIVISDHIARALGVQEYGPKILLQIMSSLCQKENGLETMGFVWLSRWLNVLYKMSLQTSQRVPNDALLETDIIGSLQNIAFIPLSDGSYSSLEQGAIWLHDAAIGTSFGGEVCPKVFPCLYAKLRTVNPLLLSATALDTDDVDIVDSARKMLQRIGVKQLSGHEIVKLHILPNLCDDQNKNDPELLVDYLCFVMVHLQSSCPSCVVDGGHVMGELQNRALILTNYGFKRSSEVSIHFSEEYGNPINVNGLIDVLDLRWHVLDSAYLRHPVTKLLSRGLVKWRDFFEEVGITNFVRVVQVKKSVSDVSCVNAKKMLLDVAAVAEGSVVKDWESYELVHMISLLLKSGNSKGCKHLLEILDTHWGDYFSDKAMSHFHDKSTGEIKTFRSSFLSSICDVQWVASSMDDILHYPKDLFYDSDVVRSIMGPSAPYAVPKVKSTKLLSNMGFKTEVRLDDVLEVLKRWQSSQHPFKTSVAQMSRLYAFVWNEVTTLRKRIPDEFITERVIFIPCASEFKPEDPVFGTFHSPEEVYWKDLTGSMKLLNEIYSKSDPVDVCDQLCWKTLSSIYPGLFDFFVKECRVLETPPFHSYTKILEELSTTALPSQAANAVFQIFSKWNDELLAGSLQTKDLNSFKECLAGVEFKVLPTVQDRWVSLHSTYGVLCWCDDEKLKKEFKNMEGVDFLYLREHDNNDQGVLHKKINALLRTLGVPSLSEIVTRQALYCGLVDGSSKSTLVSWALPYAQRYIYCMHPEKYFELKESGFHTMKRLGVFTVESLFYRNVIKRCSSVSSKQHECSCVLQGNILYVAEESDNHALFLELSRLWFDGTPELHIANFLHMIISMVELGSTMEQIEHFVVHSQKVTKLPEGEAVWSIATPDLSLEHDESMLLSSATKNEKGKTNSKSEIKAWPPLDWKTAPDFRHAREHGIRVKATFMQPSSSLNGKREDEPEVAVVESNSGVPIKFDADWKVGGDSSSAPKSQISRNPNVLDQFFQSHCSNAVVNLQDSIKASEELGLGPPNFYYSDQLNGPNLNGEQAKMTGRVGELVAYEYFARIAGDRRVNWVNELSETGLPYDIVIGDDVVGREYIEVKATKSRRKDWFVISSREWQYAAEMGEAFSIARVVLLEDGTATVSVFKNPTKLCQLGRLQLVVLMPRQQSESGVS